MFRKSRRMIVVAITGSMLLIFAVTISAILLSSYYKTNRENAEMLERYASLYTLQSLPGTELPPEGLPGGGPDGLPPVLGGPPSAATPVYQLSTFYSVALSEDGEVLAVDNVAGVYPDGQLEEIARGLLAGGKSSGRTASLSYLVEGRDGYTLVAFMDNTVTDESYLELVRQTLLVGGAAMVVMFVFSVLLAHRIIRPLEENDRKQKQFISDAGHELKTPVSIISTNAEILSRKTGSSEWLENIVYENGRMGELVTQLLELSRAENGAAEKTELDFSRLVTGEALPFESVAFEHGLTIRSGIEAGITVCGDRSRLAQLVSILLDNAVRYSDGGSEIGLTLQRQGRSAVLSVVNSGKEIPEEARERLFERFYRADGVRNSESRHYGLGLAIAKAITEAHGGRISVRCGDGRVTFSVALPLGK